jgi:hypothetical protein
LLLLGASVRAHAATEPQVVLFGLSSRILHESELSPEIIELLELRERGGDDERSFNGPMDPQAPNPTILSPTTLSSK